MFDEENQPEPSIEADTENATKFHGYDASPGSRLDDTESLSEYYRRLANINAGIWTGEWADKEALRRSDNLAIFDAISGQLELTPYQKRIARTQFDELNLRELSSPSGIDTPLVAIIVSAIVCRQDGRIYHPNRSDNSNDELFTNLLTEFDYRDSVVRSCYDKVLNRVSL
jgi:hypothetical protein